MIHPTLDSIRLFLHVLGVAVWVGGQLVLGGVVPKLRANHPDSLQTVATAFARLAWPALGLVVVTGAWSLASISASEQTGEWLVTLAVKLVCVALAIGATLIHSQGRTKTSIALGATISLVASLVAMFLGLLLAHAA